jgi:NAD(P)H dehydrogenase (quinone)
MGAPGQAADVPLLSDPTTLEEYDAVLFGIPTRYGNFPAQWKAFLDNTGKQWANGSYWGKYAGLFVSTGTQGGGQESTCIAAMSTLAHHGFIYVPLGYKYTFADLANLDEVHGGSPWGAGTFSAGDGSRQPSALELRVAQAQGKAFWETVSKAHGAWLDGSAAEKKAVVETKESAETPNTVRVKDPEGPQEKKNHKESEGPCGLPAKCDIM